MHASCENEYFIETHMWKFDTVIAQKNWVCVLVEDTGGLIVPYSVLFVTCVLYYYCLHIAFLTISTIFVFKLQFWWGIQSCLRAEDGKCPGAHIRYHASSNGNAVRCLCACHLHHRAVVAGPTRTSIPASNPAPDPAPK